METNETILARRSVRIFKKDKIDNNILEDAIYYASKSPSAHNRQPWKFMIVSDEQKNRIADALYKKTKDIVGHTGPHTANIIKETPNLIVVFIDNQIPENRDHDMLSIGAAIENMLLYLTNLDLGSLWIANTDNIKDEMKIILNTKYETVSCVAIGYKNQDPHERPRKEMNEIIIK